MNDKSILEQIYEIDDEMYMNFRKAGKILLGQAQYDQLCEELRTISGKYGAPGINEMRLCLHNGYVGVQVVSGNTIEITEEMMNSNTTLEEEINAMLDEVCGSRDPKPESPNAEEKVCKCERLIHGHEPGCPYYKEK